MLLSQSSFISSIVTVFIWQMCKSFVFGDITVDSNETTSITTINITTESSSSLLNGVDAPVQMKYCDCQYKRQECGMSNTIELPRIVGGHETKRNQYPWAARLSVAASKSFCGGTLINERYVLTAAHCSNNLNWFLRRAIKVTLGDHSSCSDDSTKWSSYVSSVITPPYSSYPNLGQDIALLRLSKPAPFNYFIRPICLPETSDYSNQYGTIIGWGRLSEGGTSSCTLQEVTLPILSNELCFEHTNISRVSYMLREENLMCAGFLTGQADSCQGDSGGPIFVRRNDGRHEIVGIVSWGFGCGRPYLPGIYTRVTRHLNWIRRNSRDGCYC